MTLDEDLMEELRRERAWQRRRRLNTSCADGYCGADDCYTCRPTHLPDDEEDDQ